MNISIEITGNLLHYLDSKVSRGSYKSRSEVVRTAIREMIQRDLAFQLRAKGITPETLGELRGDVAEDILAEDYKELIYKIIIDTSTFFSGFYNPKGNEARLLELADEGKCEILVCDYVLKELWNIFLRKGMGFGLVDELLDTFRNIRIIELGMIDDAEARMAKEVIADQKDRPIFVFAHREIRGLPGTLFVTGDKGFFLPRAQRELGGGVMTTRRALSEIEDQY